jgi:Holliday junction resolvase
MVNYTEEKFRNTYKKRWPIVIKLQVNPLAHCKTVADFLCIDKNQIIAVECKQVTEPNQYLAVSRLTQLHKLLAFNKLNGGYFFIGFKFKKHSKNRFFLVNVEEMLQLIEGRKSLKLVDFEEWEARYHPMS